jgi:hypothetical protein
LKAVAGRVSRVGVLWDFDVEIYRRDWQEPLNEAASVLGMTVQEPVLIAGAEDLPQAIDVMKRRADAFIATSGAFMFYVRRELADLALRARLPAIAAFKEFPETGLLELGPRPCGYQPAGGPLRRQDIEGRESRGPADRVTEQVRARDQPQDGARARPHRRSVATASRDAFIPLR